MIELVKPEKQAAPVDWWALMVEAEEDDKDGTPEQRLAKLYLTPRDEAIPNDELGDDIHQDIYDLFWRALSIIRAEVNPALMITIEPSYDDTTYFQFANLEESRIYYKDWIKAWRFTFDNEAAFNKWAQAVADKIASKPKTYVVVITSGYVPDILLITTDREEALRKGKEYAGDWEHVIEDEGCLYFNQAEDGNMAESVSVFEVTPEA